MIIGNFVYDSLNDVYSGEITTLTLQRSDVVLRPNDKTGERGPDYRIVQERDGAAVEFGAAWKRNSERGRAFLSIMLDDPALPLPLYAAMFLADRDETATLVWQRQQRKAVEPEPAPARPRKSAAPRPNAGQSRPSA
jgi:uncharacterized protein (DUF736 family)